MAKLLGTRTSGGLVEKTWLHTGDDGKDRITVQTLQDTSAIMKQAKLKAQNQGKEFRFKAKIPNNEINKAIYQAAKSWGCSNREAMSEFMVAKTDRAKLLWKMLTESREFRNFQAKGY